MLPCKNIGKLAVTKEMDLKPFMNLMVVLIPMLLVSAEFAKVAIVDVKIPEKRGTNTHIKDTEPKNENDGKLSLTAIITDSVVTIGAKGGFLPSIYYREFHEYVANDDQSEFIVPYERGVLPRHPQSGREMKLNERENILLYACDEKKNIMNRYYTKYNELLVDKNDQTVDKISVGDTLLTTGTAKRMIVVRDIRDFELKPLSVYDELQKRLSNIKERYHDAEDANEIIIAAEDGVLYDKVIQIMDKAKASDYGEISIAKVRS